MGWLKRVFGGGDPADDGQPVDRQWTPPPADRGALGPVMPRPTSTDAALLAASPAGVRAYERVAYLARTESGPFGAGSGFGGQPYLPDGVDHPVCPGCQRPLSLVAQLDTASLPDGVVRGDGLVQLFYCGPGLDDPDCDPDLAAWEAFSPVHVQRLVPRGSGATSMIGTPLSPHRIVGWLTVREIPDWQELHRFGVDVGDPPDEEEPFPYAGEKLGGWPSWVQGIEYPSCPECGTEMALILQIDSERTLPTVFGDMGIGHLTQCPNHPAVLGFAWACS